MLLQVESDQDTQDVGGSVSVSRAVANRNDVCFADGQYLQRTLQPLNLRRHGKSIRRRGARQSRCHPALNDYSFHEIPASQYLHLGPDI
jgi:hypothetical protein